MSDIREKIACIVCGNDRCNHEPLEPPPKYNPIMCPENLAKADSIISYLKSQNVVRGVDRELPKTNPSEDKMRSRLTIPSATVVVQQDMLKAGYVAVEELDE